MLATTFILSWFKPKQRDAASVQQATGGTMRSTSDTSFVSCAINNKLVNVTMAEEDSDLVAIDCQPLTYAEVASLAPPSKSKPLSKNGAAAAAAAAIPVSEDKEEQYGAGTTVGVPLTSEYDLTKSGYHYKKSLMEKKKQHAFVENKKKKHKKNPKKIKS
ncbi:uncharacterized protein KQ657_003620 [Scheffersomyces spartinae]|uniref:Uncharacterized protein n=1 Tax=Scheffersomyces spartinae TaxID=45513 RepID=A0A9P7V4W4_9ASCO|nr:uncharacterized protein KQ657_003620 [Scheffersomyces spartinae]KAG7191282.1 hypothetical protein KQ657_003620 [Scheffersomyces spartinae]